MHAGWALLIWAIVAILIYLIARNFKIRTFSAIVLAAIVAGIVLALLYRPTGAMFDFSQSAWDSLVKLVLFLSPIIVLIYAVSKIVTDRSVHDGKTVNTPVRIQA